MLDKEKLLFLIAEFEYNQLINCRIIHRDEMIQEILKFPSFSVISKIMK